MFFFRTKVIISAWVNDEHSLRAYGSKTDATAGIRSILESGPKRRPS
nr:hypothetical protein [Rhizobium sp. SL86]